MLADMNHTHKNEEQESDHGDKAGDHDTFAMIDCLGSLRSQIVQFALNRQYH